VVIATKFGMRISPGKEGARPDYVHRAAADSLRRLGTDHIDLYQLHEPDPSVPIADTLGALEDLVRAGKVREIGCSNFSAAQLREARAACEPGAAQFVSLQNELSLLQRQAERDVLPECGRLGIKFLPYFPLASGLLTGKYMRGEPAPDDTRMSQSWAARRFFTDDRIAVVDALTAFARSRDRSVLDLAMSWLAVRPIVASVIAGATSPEQVRQNAAAAGWQLTDADRAEIDRITGAD
jgi:aryl-alcohol dehydrogenase-like predicted oxidoreductase